MRYELEKDFRFESAHQLPQHDGKCRRLHGHSFVMTVAVQGKLVEDAGPKTGMLIDYSELKAIVDPIVESKLDHYFLNEQIPLANPTSENLARWVAGQVVRGLHARGYAPSAGGGVLLTAVTIHETCTARCTFRPDATDIESFLASDLVQSKELTS